MIQVPSSENVEMCGVLCVVLMMNVIFDVNRYINKTYHIVRYSFISSCCCKAQPTPDKWLEFRDFQVILKLINIWETFQVSLCM